jgi:hypothetical protein
MQSLIEDLATTSLLGHKGSSELRQRRSRSSSSTLVEDLQHAEEVNTDNQQQNPAGCINNDTGEEVENTTTRHEK